MPAIKDALVVTVFKINHKAKNHPQIARPIHRMKLLSIPPSPDVPETGVPLRSSAKDSASSALKFNRAQFQGAGFNAEDAKVLAEERRVTGP